MERLIKVGSIIPKKSFDVIESRIGIGFEKLDRDVFDPYKAYDKVSELGVKWVRIQSGWAKTEKTRGVYDFSWLDDIVDNLLSRGLSPWMCLCYGNGLYDENAAKIFGSVGCPPIYSEEAEQAWKKYVTALVEHYKGKISYYEIWNEPDGKWCWKNGVNATELGSFTRKTAQIIKSVDENAKTVGGVVCLRSIAYLNRAFKAGMGDYLDYVSFHEYTADETTVFERVETLEALARQYNPNIGIIQGESGSQSKSGGNGALCVGAWTEKKQAKQLARHTVADLMTDVLFTSYFSCIDMIEALNGEVGKKATYLDYGYFGVLGADFDENGVSVGTYYKKPSYYALQNIASVFAEGYEKTSLPVMFMPKWSDRIFGNDKKRREVITGAFSRKDGDAIAFWYPSDIMTTDFEGTVTVEICTKYEKIQLVDLMDGSIYDIPDSIKSRDEFGTVTLTHLPIKDTPMLITMGEFIK